MDDVECIEIHKVNESLRCSFYLDTPDCHDADGKLDYMYFIFCYFDHQHSWVAIFLCVLWLLLLFVGLGVTADDFLCPSLVVITKTLHLSQNIAGVTFLAFGNGAPDIFSSVAGIEQARPELVIGTLFGAGIFVTSAVAGAIIVSTPFKIMERPFLRDIVFYVCASFWAFLRFYYEEVTIWHSVGFVAMYILYIIVVIVSRIVYNRFREKDKASTATSPPSIEVQSVPPVENGINSVAFEPDIKDDNPEAEGVVLRRFSFRGSISVPKRRVSSTHSHHEHIIRSMTQSIENHPNPVFKNGQSPHALETQISKTSMSSLLSDFSDEHRHGMCKEFFLHICPIDIQSWHERSVMSRIIEVFKAPVCFVLILTVPVVDYENDKSNWCRLLNVIQCITAPMFVVMALEEHHTTVGKVPVWAAVLVAAFLLSVIVLWRSSTNEPPCYHWAYGYVGFITSVIWVYLIASEIVSLLKAIGVVFKLSDAILGLTVLAWGNSIGDFISNLSVARQGYPRMGISACYGGPLLNLLLGIGIPYTLMIVKLGHPLQLVYKRLISLLYGTLCVILISTMVTMTALRFTAKRWFGLFLLAMYVVFLTIAILMETGVM